MDNNYEQLRHEDMMQPKPSINQDPLRREDMMQPNIDINDQFNYEEEQAVHRKR